MGEALDVVLSYLPMASVLSPYKGEMVTVADNKPLRAPSVSLHDKCGSFSVPKAAFPSLEVNIMILMSRTASEGVHRVWGWSKTHPQELRGSMVWGWSKTPPQEQQGSTVWGWSQTPPQGGTS